MSKKNVTECSSCVDEHFVAVLDAKTVNEVRKAEKAIKRDTKSGLLSLHHVQMLEGLVVQRLSVLITQ